MDVALLSAYTALETARDRARERAGEDGEDKILEAMDAVWELLTSEERDELNARIHGEKNS